MGQGWYSGPGAPALYRTVAQRARPHPTHFRCCRLAGSVGPLIVVLKAAEPRKPIGNQIKSSKVKIIIASDDFWKFGPSSLLRDSAMRRLQALVSSESS